VLSRPADTKGLSAAEALRRIELDLEYFLDFASFQIQRPFACLTLDICDVSPPVSVDDDREMLVFPFPQGYPSPKFRQMFPLGDVRGLEAPEPTPEFGRKSAETSAALRWYSKALAVPYQTDQFAFFWIALEINCLAW
jgi:hypothetical protein